MQISAEPAATGEHGTERTARASGNKYLMIEPLWKWLAFVETRANHSVAPE